MIVQAIFEGLLSFVMGIFKLILEVVVKFVIAPLIQLLFQIIIYTSASLFYSIATFFLGLIDFVEILFRLLAGLPEDRGSISLGDISKSGNSIESGDLLLQVIMTDAVRDVFISMCIVGLFLLVITTVFQMIKVEYTTEGAKNAKGPILTKAFKGLCNMVLIPILVIFGVFIGNQVLDLLDKATKPDSTPAGSPTIAGVLFATSASDAFYKADQLKILMPEVDLLNGGLTTILLNLVPIVVNIFTEMDWDGDGEEANREIAYDEVNQKTILDRFIRGTTGSYISETAGEDAKENASETKDWLKNINIMTVNGSHKQGEGVYHHYSNTSAVTAYFNIGKINYLVLFFGGAFVLKCLYYACFGLVTRLYQCTMLFIISPAIIGMTPINEGNIGKWRGKFIGSCLSAYGVVVAVNIFFILVQIFLNIELHITGIGHFSDGLLSGIFKMIFVLAGCIIIEKFAKEIGSYFGAEDAISTGKETEKGVTEGAQKAVKLAAGVAGTVATGGAGAVALAGRMAAGAKASKAAGNSVIGGGIRGAFGIKQKENEAEKEKAQDARERMADNQEKLSNLAFDEKKEKRLEELTAKGKKRTKSERDEYYALKGDKKTKETLEKDINTDQSIVNEYDNKKAKIDKYNANYGKHDRWGRGEGGLVGDTYRSAKVGLTDAVINTSSLLTGAKKEMFGSIMPKSFKDMGKWSEDMRKNTAKYSDEAEQALKGRDERKKDKEKEAFEALPITSKMVDSKHKVQDMKVEKLFVDKNALLAQNSRNEVDGIIKNMNQMLAQRNQYAKDTYEYRQADESINRMKEHLMTSKGISLSDINVNTKGEFEFTGTVGLPEKEFKAALDEAIKKSGGKFDEAAQQALIDKFVKHEKIVNAEYMDKLIKEVKSAVESAK